MRFLLYLAIAFILWRIVLSFTRGGSKPPSQVRGTPPREVVTEPRRGPDIDYSRVRDADYRDLDDPGRSQKRDRGAEQPGSSEGREQRIDPNGPAR